MHLMIDIETFGILPTAPMIQIGLTKFNQAGLSESYKVNLDLVDVILSTGFLPDKETVDWWRKQQKPDRSSLMTLEKGLNVVRSVFYSYVSETDEIWANGPQFDIVILENHFRAIGMEIPWTHKVIRDFRTIRKLATDMGLDGIAIVNESPHDAMADSDFQARLLIQLLEFVKGTRNV